MARKTHPGYLVYHPERKISRAGDITIYHDSLQGNQDPYIWCEPFLHTYCHITQFSSEVEQIVFWVSGSSLNRFDALWCDLVFVVAQKCYWTKRNAIASDDPLVDSPRSFRDHYQWAGRQHRLRRRRRFTLKADPERSWQPQRAGTLIDVLPMLVELGFSLTRLRTSFTAGVGSRPVPLKKSHVDYLYEQLGIDSTTKLRGRDTVALLDSIPVGK